MATLKELLGDAYKEDMTLADVASAISDKKLVDLSTGDYVGIGKFRALENERNAIKAKYDEKLTEEEKTQQVLAEREQHYKDIERENAVYKIKAKLGSTIQDEETLNKVAEAFANGDIETALEAQSAYMTSAMADLEAKIKTEMLHNNPQPNPQKENPTITKEQFHKLSMVEKQKLYTEQPELFAQLNQ